MIRQTLFATVVLVAAALFPVRSFSADVFTLQIPETTETVRTNNPCFGRITATLTYSGVFQVIQNGNSFHAHIQIHGHGTVVPDDPNQEAFEGNFSEVQVQSVNPNTSIDTIVVTQLGLGRMFHITFHIVADSSGNLLAQVLNVSCG